MRFRDIACYHAGMPKDLTVGRAVRGSKSGRPIMAAFDLLGRRWTMRILWALSQGPCTFRALAERVGEVVPSTLNRRLQDMKEAQLVMHDGVEGYQLTELGVGLVGALIPLREWSNHWARFVDLSED